MTSARANEIYTLLKTYIDNPQPELNFRNNFELLIAVILSAQTTDKRVNIVTEKLFKEFPDAYSLAKASYNEVFTIIASLGLASNKAKHIISLANILVDDYQGKVPNSFSDLVKLPGVGRKTANVVLAVGFNVPAFPVDTHVERVAKRLGFSPQDNSVLKVEEALCQYIPKNKWAEAHHVFLLFGRYHCLSQNPLCEKCRLKNYCQR